ncbi:phenylalanine--tRNA ligase subunit beta [Parageobacillus thermoglucosidasius]|uniref:Phenylalanine--tRNA ligase beta subunit n=1 Tax=Parageobacillus thermoglucosidasius TaxID=1426 RepID=A0AAN1D833_PARTM|nr:phenylalanine--tRNA ligase subunit beta [Parageobacillus thermoglucosidasius]KYD14014.1 Phenylalanyl-tRNA synthetase beta chain [Anoxybacillus flavithermus]REK55852.1 MAG: phenylalanine--tRNA ligase subunit beta [Geobacillus sp.]ALF11761.1 phenylalanyl-tRNA synthase subunit beta [Parageobacillus thermoglucosidasius]ANZ31844.1 phenylalanine--tRNA ligase subunit beta [Parageobacillus thermoglucosidasius]APM82579.1 phenylalanine--tRNA ligase subunit beta [Parageobacillus thermoglucosidasius]
MFVSYKWLQEYVDLTGITAKELADRITKSGIEVESVEVLNKGAKGVVVGHVLEREQHPNADKLSKCLVDIGEGEPVQIICGAPNVAKGQKVAVAKVGAVLPGGLKIKRAKLRGEESNGMICSLQELGIESKLVPKEYADGIFVFPSDAPVGADALELLNLDDEVLELGLTPNRADCLSMIGVAYEVAAILGRNVKLPVTEIQENGENVHDYISVRVDAPEDNPVYAGRIVKNVKIGPSPLWMQARLMAAGIRPHNNVVDITNYILLEYGQPLHAFDYDRLGSKEIVVRRAKAGETIVTLDDTKRTLTEDHLVITNGTEPVALAGVMGGANSEVRDDTTTVFIESAYFTSPAIRKASKDLGLRSEASTRFEKGIDPARTKEALDRAAALMAEYAGGEVIGGVVEVNTLKEQEVTVTVTLDRINRVLGTAITKDEVAAILTNLQFAFTENNGTFTITVPSRRRDISIEEDIIEEVARLYGYDRLPATLPVAEAKPGKLTPYQAKRRQVRRYLEDVGLFQAITYSLTSAEKATMFALETAEPIRLALPMSEERSVLRQSLIPHLLEVASYNRARQVENIAVYETGAVYLASGENELPSEKERLAGIITGVWHAHLWQGEKKAVDFYVAKGILDGLFELLGLTNRIEYKQAKREHMHPGRTADILLDGKTVGFVGQLHPVVQKEYDLKETYVFELALADLLNADVEDIRYAPIPRFPSIARDIALVVDENVVAGELQKAIIEAGGSLLKEVSIFDVYKGDRLPDGKKSIAFSLRYYDPERTLTDEEVTAVHEKVIQAVKQQFGATLRG